MKQKNNCLNKIPKNDPYRIGYNSLIYIEKDYVLKVSYNYNDYTDEIKALKTLGKYDISPKLISNCWSDKFYDIQTFISQNKIEEQKKIRPFINTFEFNGLGFIAMEKLNPTKPTLLHKEEIMRKCAFAYYLGFVNGEPDVILDNKGIRILDWGSIIQNPTYEEFLQTNNYILNELLKN